MKKSGNNILFVIVAVVCIIVVVNTVEIKTIFNGFKELITQTDGGTKVGEPLTKISGDTDVAEWQSFDIPDGTAVIYPKRIKVTFMDDKEITFENDIYMSTSDFYGGQLKDKK